MQSSKRPPDLRTHALHNKVYRNIIHKHQFTTCQAKLNLRRRIGRSLSVGGRSACTSTRRLSHIVGPVLGNCRTLPFCAIFSLSTQSRFYLRSCNLSALILILHRKFLPPICSIRVYHCTTTPGRYHCVVRFTNNPSALLDRITRWGGAILLLRPTVHTIPTSNAA